MHLLIAEDHAPMGQALATCLRNAGHAATWVEDGDAALAALRVQTYDLLVLDHGLPRASSADVLCAARAQLPQRPVLLISALDDAEARLAERGLQVDAFLVKPLASMSSSSASRGSPAAWSRAPASG